MPSCPRCQSAIDSTAIRCPHCYNELKAFGHPGITLHQAPKGTYLCSSCLYDRDDTCDYPQRPYADSCTLYQNHQKIIQKVPEIPPLKRIENWCRRNQPLLLVLGLVIVSIIIAL
ncbi:MAG: hypothetical protein N5P05_000284 [Chroococcopsis gigantea SAG 12.99]|jgi:hypothetical protein|nr:hypothetical protein [Chroococcopsis gigantea SAG 12.99]